VRPTSLTRRDLLAAGGLGLLGAGAVAAGGRWLPSARADALAPPVRLVVVTALGGWDVSYALDPKPGSPFVDGPELDERASDDADREAVRRFGEIDVMTNPVKRPSVHAFFDAWADRAAVVRGLWVGSISHDACRARVLTGAPSGRTPDIAAMVAEGGGAAAALPYMDLGGASYAGSLAALTGRAGKSQQLRYLLDRRLDLPGPEGAGLRYPQYVPTPLTRDAMATVQEARAEAFRARWAGASQATARLDDLTEARARAERTRADGARLARQLGDGTVTGMNSQVDIALDLLDSGMSHTVLLDSGFDWDTHTELADQHAMYESLFAGLDRLATGLDDAGLLDGTVVAVLSEMTRTPRRNAAGGKDHWPVTSAMLFGGPVAGGRVLGASDERLDARPIALDTGIANPAGVVLRYDHLAAALVGGLGGDAARWLGGVPPLGGLWR
jgi:hypothetical protein